MVANECDMSSSLSSWGNVFWMDGRMDGWGKVEAEGEREGVMQGKKNENFGFLFIYLFIVVFQSKMFMSKYLV